MWIASKGNDYHACDDAYAKFEKEEKLRESQKEESNKKK
jgi:hypothetical protein